MKTNTQQKQLKTKYNVVQWKIQLNDAWKLKYSKYVRMYKESEYLHDRLAIESNKISAQIGDLEREIENETIN